jgi:hypothetical protein
VCRLLALDVRLHAPGRVARDANGPAQQLAILRSKLVAQHPRGHDESGAVSVLEPTAAIASVRVFPEASTVISLRGKVADRTPGPCFSNGHAAIGCYDVRQILMRSSLLAIFYFLAQVSASATQNPKALIEGIVLGIGDQPIAGAEVKAFWSPPPLSVNLSDVPTAITDSNGTFRIEVDPGGYRIYVNASGYVYQEHGAEPGKGNPGTIVTLTQGQSLNGITVRPIRDNILSGRITSTAGEPLLRMEAYALRRIFDANGAPLFLSEGRAETNDRGEYRIPGLKTGRYYIRATSIASYVIEGEVRRAQLEGRPAPVPPTPGVFAST